MERFGVAEHQVRHDSSVEGAGFDGDAAQVFEFTPAPDLPGNRLGLYMALRTQDRKRLRAHAGV